MTRHTSLKTPKSSSDAGVDGWYRASGRRATFGFRVDGGRVVETAAYARSWLRGLTWAAAWEKLHASGFDVSSLRGDS